MDDDELRKMVLRHEEQLKTLRQCVREVLEIERDFAKKTYAVTDAYFGWLSSIADLSTKLAEFVLSQPGGEEFEKLKHNFEALVELFVQQKYLKQLDQLSAQLSRQRKRLELIEGGLGKGEDNEKGEP